MSSRRRARFWIVASAAIASLTNGCKSASTSSVDAGSPAGPQCGDGVRSDPETCDDGNRRDGDGCSRRCREETPAPACEAEVCRDQVYEWTITFDDSAYSNPWEEVTVTAELGAPSGATVSIHGFYYDADTWKIRFAPPEAGTYSYSHRLDDASGTQLTRSGELTVGTSNERGFLRKHPSNPHRFVYAADGGLFGAIGLSTCVRDPVARSFPTLQEPKGWCIDKYEATDDACGKTWEAWAEVYLDEMGVDLFRWSVNNCSYPLWAQLETDRSVQPPRPNNVYDAEYGRWGDLMLRDLRERGVRIFLDPVGFGWQQPPAGRMRCGPRFDQDCGSPVCGANHDKPCTDQNAARIDTNDVEALERYFTYVVARYGAYVDIWELINEFTLPDSTIERLANHIRRLDPYDHPVTTSWARPDHAAIDLSSPHVYQRSNTYDIDTVLLDAVVAGNYGHESFPKAVHNKPIIVGELGEPFMEPGADVDDAFADRTRIGTRIKMWTAFFNEVGGVIWESSLSGAKFLGGVVFCGPELRRHYDALGAFTADVDADVRPTPIQTHASGTVRQYTLRGAANVYAYFVHAVPDVARPTAVEGLSIELEAPAAGTLEWYRPDTGQVIERAAITAGRQTVRVPRFDYDLALRTVER